MVHTISIDYRAERRCDKKINLEADSMSVEQVKAFFAKIKEDSTLAQKLKDAQAAYNGDTSDKAAAFAEIVIPVAKSAGFNFTVDDFKATFDNNGEGEAS